MKAIAEGLKEIKHILVSLCVVDSLIESLIVFLVGVLFLTQFKLNWVYAIMPALVYYIYRTISLISKRNLILVESKVPELNEKLRTVADHLGKNNEIIDSLNLDVLHLMKKIKTSYFINFGGILRKLVILFIVSVLVIFISSINVKLIDLKDLLKPLWDDQGSGAYFLAQENQSELITDADIYGDEEVVELGKEKLDLTLSIVESDVNIDEVKDVEDKEFSANFPGTAIGALADVSYEEDFAKDYKEVVKNYFDKISDKQ